MTPVGDIGEARVEVPVDPKLRALKSYTAQQCMDVAARLMVLASELDPDMPGVVAPGVAAVPRQDETWDRRLP